MSARTPRARVLPVAGMLLRPGTIDRATLLLPVVAFGAVTALLLAVAGGAQTFWQWDDDLAVAYRFLAVIALALLVVPLVGLGGAAARLSSRRRDDRLATLRLLGASRTFVQAVTVIEASALALVGAVVGAVGYLALAPGLALIPFRGAALGIGGVLLPWWAVAAVVAGVVLLAVASAILGLRRVVVSPLGVRMRTEAERVRGVGALVGVAVVAAAAFVPRLFGAGAEATFLVIALGAGFGAALAALGLVGPWVLKLLARAQVRTARTPARLIAARGLLESPRQAWRQVSAVAMTSFVAVFAGCGTALLAALGDEGGAEQRMLAADIRTGLLVTVVGTFLMVACAAGVNQAVAVLDRAPLHRGLGKLGMPVATMDAARRRQIMSPLLLAAVGSAAVAAVVLFPLVGATLLLDPVAVVVIAAMIGGGVLLVRTALLATRPLLRRAAAA